MNSIQLPSLPLDDWEETKNTLHLFLQVVGKIRLKLFPKTNHWWHVPFYVSCRGLTTRPIPYKDKLFDINFDFIDHQLVIQCSDGPTQHFPLQGQSVASFYQQVLEILTGLGITVEIKAVPYDVPFSTIPFAKDDTHASYDPQYIEKYWHILKFVDSVFEEFRGRFIGKSTPVHLFWHHADLALTRFSGKTAPLVEGMGKADQEAYSHEVVSFGFWAGDDMTREPAFYAYVYPEPEGIANEPFPVTGAQWRTDYGYTMAFMPYEVIRNTADAKAALLNYLEGAYGIFASHAGWDIDAFEYSKA